MENNRNLGGGAGAALVPSPAAMAGRDGVFRFVRDTPVVFPPALGSEAALAAALLGGALGFGGPLPLAVESGVQAPPGALRLRLLRPWDGGPEAYRLRVSPDGILVEAGAPEGAWWALEDIRQLVLGEGAAVPCFECRDAPRFGWRGVMLDCSRHFFTPAFIKKLIDAASLLHLNRFHWHLTDDQGWRLPVEGWPRLTEVGAFRAQPVMPPSETGYGGFYTHAEIRDVVSFAAARHVMVVPEIETPGHASALLAAYPSLGCSGGPYQVESRWGIFDDVLCAGNDGVLRLLDDVFETVASLFPSPYIHMGGDECPRTRWESCPRCRRRMRDEGLATADGLQSWMAVRTAALIAKRGRRAIGWDEVLDGTEELGLPKDVVVMSWRGVEGGLRASAAGHQVIMCPQTAGCYLDFKNFDSPEEPGARAVATTRDSYSFDPAPPGMGAAKAALVLGGQANLWTEKVLFSKAAEYMLFPRLAAIAEALWTPRERKDFGGFAIRLETLERALDRLGFCFYKGPLG